MKDTKKNGFLDNRNPSSIFLNNKASSRITYGYHLHKEPKEFSKENIKLFINLA